jgi:NAD(P)-dependent dehydrogenase (short-subunit alcohol dehydrogenase family)
MRIEGARALVAGGASGLGEATARRLHAAGAHVTVADVNGERGEALAAELGDGRAAFVACDVTDPATVEAAVATAADGEGGLRISVSCAGVGWAEKVAGNRHGAHQLEFYEKVIAINLIGTFNVLRIAATAMIGNEPDAGGESGVCVNTSSIAYADGQIGQIAYAASKGGVASMTLPAARDLARHRHPGGHDRAPACSTRRCSPRCRSRPARRWAPLSRIPPGSGCRTSTARSWPTSSRTRCSTARSSGWTGPLRMAPR